jgi:hypothetical protein
MTMPRSRVIAHGDELQIRLGGRPGQSRRARLPSVSVSSPKPKGIQAIVKVGYFRAGRVPGYLAYIERDGTAGSVGRDGTTAVQGYSGYMAREGTGEDGQQAELFTREGSVVDREAFVNRSRGDPRAWTIIISPGSNELDMERYIREFMRQVELDLSKRLDWIAAVHRNTEFTHSHILLRGKDREGRAFRMPRDYISQGLRTRATEIAQLYRELGRTRQHQAIQEPSRQGSRLARLHSRLEAWISVHAREGRER